MLEINWAPGARDLRQFALLWLVAFGLAGLAVFARAGTVTSGALAWWAAGAGVGLLGSLRPAAVRPLYLAWMAAAFPVGWLVSHAVLAVLFFVLFTGCAVLFRIVGRDRLRRRFDRDARSYWVERRQAAGPGQYLKQF